MGHPWSLVSFFFIFSCRIFFCCQLDKNSDHWIRRWRRWPLLDHRHGPALANFISGKCHLGHWPNVLANFIFISCHLGNLLHRPNVLLPIFATHKSFSHSSKIPIWIHFSVAFLFQEKKVLGIFFCSIWKKCQRKSVWKLLFRCRIGIRRRQKRQGWISSDSDFRLYRPFPGIRDDRNKQK